MAGWMCSLCGNYNPWEVSMCCSCNGLMIPRQVSMAYRILRKRERKLQGLAAINQLIEKEERDDNQSS
jgi:hypothetical protein